MANSQVFAPTKKIGELAQKIFWTKKNKRMFFAELLPLVGQGTEPTTYSPTMEGWDEYLRNHTAKGGELRATISIKLCEMADAVLKANGVEEGFPANKWPYTGIANTIYSLLTGEKGVSFRIYNWPPTCDPLQKADAYTVMNVKTLLQCAIVGFVKYNPKDGNETVLPGTVLRMEAFTRGKHA
jgi:hypothetical protein